MICFKSSKRGFEEVNLKIGDSCELKVESMASNLEKTHRNVKLKVLSISKRPLVSTIIAANDSKTEYYVINTGFTPNKAASLDITVYGSDYCTILNKNNTFVYLTKNDNAITDNLTYKKDTVEPCYVPVKVGDKVRSAYDEIFDVEYVSSDYKHMVIKSSTNSIRFINESDSSAMSVLALHKRENNA